MKVKAKHWLNHNGTWHKGGEIFDVDDYEVVKEYADLVENDFVSDVFPPDEKKTDAPKRRGRPRKE